MRNLNILGGLRNRASTIIAAIGGAFLMAACGAVMTFVLAPGQAIKASQIAKMPQMDAAYVSLAAPGTDILITGYLNGTAPNPQLPEFIAYYQEEWEVSESSSSSSTPQPPSGSWRRVETVVPELALDMSGSPVPILAANNAILSGPNLHELLVPQTSAFTADYNGQKLGEGSIRYTGFFSGDLVTVLGKKSSSDGVVPEELFSGDRVAYEQYQKDSAKALLFMGIAAMACSPFVLIGGILAALFGRGRR
ncbi:MAG TPA: hypothetical protein PK078_08805 [Anaerolineales bacterium]|nr:hypothetical protein [Anaerolineales bacterium]